MPINTSFYPIVSSSLAAVNYPMPESWMGYKLTGVGYLRPVNAASSGCIFLQGLAYRKMHLELDS
jgi:hypothetical protein